MHFGKEWICSLLCMHICIFRINLLTHFILNPGLLGRWKIKRMSLWRRRSHSMEEQSSSDRRVRLNNMVIPREQKVSQEYNYYKTCTTGIVVEIHDACHPFLMGIIGHVNWSEAIEAADQLCLGLSSVFVRSKCSIDGYLSQNITFKWISIMKLLFTFKKSWCPII